MASIHNFLRFLVFPFFKIRPSPMQNVNLSLTEREAIVGNIGPRSWQYGPSAAGSVQKPPRANIPQDSLSRLGYYEVLEVYYMALESWFD